MNSTRELLRFCKLRFLKAAPAIAALAAIQASVLAAPPIIAVGPGAPHAPVVKRITVNGQGGNDTVTFQVYRSSFTGVNFSSRAAGVLLQINQWCYAGSIDVD